MDTPIIISSNLLFAAIGPQITLFKRAGKGQRREPVIATTVLIDIALVIGRTGIEIDA